ncbi:hypothetical protein DH2020_047061 [Rehmannia glutinosa]|uniref:F-box associated beta-propeller type 1 domain-containing protein n=1 Tax=Rehmannia glutinosa TaxID=99300 RepID=A0ABR0UA76_REHGL
MGDSDDETTVANYELLSTTLPGQSNQIYKKWLMLSSSLSQYIEHGRNRDRHLVLRYWCSNAGSRISIIDGKSEKECKVRGLEPLVGARVKLGTSYYEYHLYLFGSKTWRRTTNPYFYSQPPECWYPGKQQFSCNPVITNGALHWYMIDILIFDVISEEFCFKPLPFRECYPEGTYCLDNLLVDGDRLCCGYMRYPEPVMDIWVLEDYSNWSWIRKHTVNLDWDTIKYPLKMGCLVVGPYILTHVRLVSIHRDELVLFWNNRGMFSYHLGDNTIEKINFRKWDKMDDYYFGRFYGGKCGFMAYTATTNDF